MGIGGKDYDKFAGDFTPNKDRRMAEWKAKKEKEKKERGDKAARESAAREAEKEEKPELRGPAEITKGEQIIDAIHNAIPGSPPLRPKRSRRKHFDGGVQPTLFDEVE